MVAGVSGDFPHGLAERKSMPEGQRDVADATTLTPIGMPGRAPATNLRACQSLTNIPSYIGTRMLRSRPGRTTSAPPPDMQCSPSTE